MNYLAIGNEELGDTLIEGDVVKNKEGKRGKIENSLISPTGMYLQFIKHKNNAYLVGINGKALPGVIKC